MSDFKMPANRFIARAECIGAQNLIGPEASLADKEPERLWYPTQAGELSCRARTEAAGGAVRRQRPV